MSEYNEWDDDDTNTNDDGRGGQDNSTGMKELRKANSALKKQLSELQESYSLVTKTQRDRSVKDVLNSLGLPQKVSAFIPDDVTSEEDVTDWINEYGDVSVLIQTLKPMLKVKMRCDKISLLSTGSPKRRLVGLPIRVVQTKWILLSVMREVPKS